MLFFGRVIFHCSPMCVRVVPRVFWYVRGFSLHVRGASENFKFSSWSSQSLPFCFHSLPPRHLWHPPLGSSLTLSHILSLLKSLNQNLVLEQSDGLWCSLFTYPVGAGQIQSVFRRVQFWVFTILYILPLESYLPLFVVISLKMPKSSSCPSLTPDLACRIYSCGCHPTQHGALIVFLCNQGWERQKHLSDGYSFWFVYNRDNRPVTIVMSGIREQY